MYKHPISAFFRLFPALCWLAACAAALWMPARLYLYRAEGRWGDLGKAWPDAFMLLGFVALAIYSVRMAYKEYKQVLPALRADTPIGLGLPIRPRPLQAFTPTRYPLSATLRAELHKLIETMQRAGMLQSGDITIDEVVDAAETSDEWSKVDLYMAMKVLHALRSEREQPFANIAFFLANIETDESDAAKLVHELVRLCGRSRELSAVRIRSVSEGKIVPAHRGFPPPNAVAEFELGVEHHAVPFVLYSKDIPGGLIEALATILISADDPRRFVWDNFDSFLSVSYLTPAQTSMVNSAEQEKFPRFKEVA